jgi:hypothetical protein
MPTNTDLVIDGIVISDYAARGISFVLSPVATGSLRRDVNGTMHDMTLPQFRKYAVEISCTDHESPVLPGIWRGKEVDVTLPTGLSGEESDGQLSLTMMVDSWQTNFEEWEASLAWRLILVEK